MTTKIVDSIQIRWRSKNKVDAIVAHVFERSCVAAANIGLSMNQLRLEPSRHLRRRPPETRVYVEVVDCGNFVRAAV